MYEERGETLCDGWYRYWFKYWFDDCGLDNLDREGIVVINIDTKDLLRGRYS